MSNEKDAHLDIPAFLRGDVNNKVEHIKMASTVESAEQVESRPSKVVKANGHAKPTVKAAGKLKAKPAKVTAKAKNAPKAAAKLSKGSEKPKAAKAKAATGGAEKDQYGFRKGSTKSKAVALYARKSGATLEEVKNALGSVQLNCLVALENAGHKVLREKEERDGQRSVTRYYLKV